MQKVVYIYTHKYYSIIILNNYYIPTLIQVLRLLFWYSKCSMYILPVAFCACVNVLESILRFGRKKEKKNDLYNLQNGVRK